MGTWPVLSSGFEKHERTEPHEPEHDLGDDDPNTPEILPVVQDEQALRRTFPGLHHRQCRRFIL